MSGSAGLAIDRSADLHTHSALTDGADPPEQMAEAAARTELTSWGLSDHVRADTTWLADYVTRVRDLRAGEVAVRCGVEAKIVDLAGRLDLPRELPELDYVLIADHQFPGQDGPIHPSVVQESLTDGRLLPVEVVEQLVRATIAAIGRSPFPPILAHLFSILPKIGLEEADVGDELIDALAGALRSADAGVEVNEKWRCPSTRVLARLAAAGVRLGAGSDAHRAADIGKWSYVRELDEAGVVGAV
jgi:putative hydrolase